MSLSSPVRASRAAGAGGNQQRVARISGAGGALIVSADTPYERELLAEHIDAYTRRHGRVRVEVDHRAWDLPASVDHSPACTTCNRRLNKLTFWLGGRMTCSRCARRPATAAVDD